MLKLKEEPAGLDLYIASPPPPPAMIPNTELIPPLIDPVMILIPKRYQVFFLSPFFLRLNPNSDPLAQEILNNVVHYEIKNSGQFGRYFKTYYTFNTFWLTFLNTLLLNPLHE